MNYKILGKSTLKISEIGFGCMSMGKEDNLNASLINRALDLGINFFDTADLYGFGMNEVSLGKSLRQRRKEAVIATKVGNQWKEDRSGWEWNPGKAYILAAADKSLKRLNTDYIDLYQLHGGTREDRAEDIIEAFELLQVQGKIRYYGISSIRPTVIREYTNRSAMASVMMQYSLLDRRPEQICNSFLLPNSLGILARGSLAKGLLVGKQITSYLNYSEGEVKLAAGAIRKLSGALRTPVQTALRFVLQQAFINGALVGIRTMDQLAEAAKTSDTPALTRSEMNMLSESIPVNHYDQHT